MENKLSTDMNEDKDGIFAENASLANGGYAGEDEIADVNAVPLAGEGEATVADDDTVVVVVEAQSEVTADSPTSDDEFIIPDEWRIDTDYPSELADEGDAIDSDKEEGTRVSTAYENESGEANVDDLDHIDTAADDIGVSDSDIDEIGNGAEESADNESLPEEGEEIEEGAHCPALPYKEETYNPEKPRRIDFIFDFLELFVFTLVAVLIVTTFFVRHSIVDGGSMLNTLHDGDTLIISDLFYEPKQNDVIVIESTELGKAIVKRVIAVGGQKVMVTPTGIIVDDKELDESSYVYTDGKDYFYDLRRCDKLRNNPTFRFIPGSHYEFVVPEGEIFIMGDHRSDSKDSRDLGTLPVDAVLGKVLWRVLPFDAFGEVK